MYRDRMSISGQFVFSFSGTSVTFWNHHDGVMKLEANMYRSNCKERCDWTIRPIFSWNKDNLASF